MKRDKGFTLIELMIVVAIIGIMAAFAVQMYTDYIRRSHVAEGLTLASGAKASVTEYYASKGSFPDNNPDAGLASSITGNAVSSVNVTSDGIIEITYNTKTGESGNTITLIPATTAGGITWNCSGGTISTRLRPSACRS